MTSFFSSPLIVFVVLFDVVFILSPSVSGVTGRKGVFRLGLQTESDSDFSARVGVAGYLHPAANDGVTLGGGQCPRILPQ